MAKASADYSVAELEKILNSKRSTLQELQKKRSKLQKELNRVDQDIRAVEGRGSRRRGPRSKNKLSLRLTVQGLLLKNKKGYTLADLSQTILDSGFKTTSKNFRNVLYQCLYNTKGVYHDEASGTYKYKEPEAKVKAVSAPDK